MLRSPESVRSFALPFDESAHLTAPPSFGAYRVLHQIGSGVLGPVFRTYEPQRDRLVAVKAFKLDLVPEDMARLVDALGQLKAAGLSRPGIVPVLDAGMEGSTAYLAMEFVAGETLDVAFRHLAPAPLERALPILLAMAQALDTAWAAGFGHGALHPRDVFLRSGSDEVLITGFGIVPALEAIGFRPPARRPYAAPERIAGGPVDIRSDVYSLGAIAHELLTRRRPVGPGQQDSELAVAGPDEERDRIREVLSAALAIRPEDRFPSATAFVDALAEAGTGEPVAPSAAAAVTAPSLFEQFEKEDDGVSGVPEAPGVPNVPEVLDVTEIAPEPVELLKNWERPAEMAPMETTPEPEKPEKPERLEKPEKKDLFTSAPADVRPDPPVSRDRRPLPPAMFASIAQEPLPRSPYPWGALLAVAVAGVTLGGVAGYEIGLRRGSAASVSAATPASPPAGTDVRVPPASTPAVPTAVPAPPPTAVAEPVAPPAAPPASPATGRLSIHTVPPGATVTVNGKVRGTSPQTLRDLPLGTFTIQVTRRGYAAKTERVELSAASPSQDVTVKLAAASTAAKPAPAKPAPAKTGSLYVDTRPRGASVTIDGKPAGTTPMSVTAIGVGPHAVQMELAGYKPFSTTVTIKAGAQTRVVRTLARGGH